MLLKQLRVLLKNKGGRNNSGTITVKGKRKKKKHFHYKMNYYSKIFNVRNIIKWVGYRRQQNSYIMLVKTANSYFSYRNAIVDLSWGQEYTTSFDDRALVGNTMPLYSIPLVVDVNSVEMLKGNGSVLCRSAGTLMRVLRKHSRIGYITLRMPSKKLNYIKWDCVGSVGQNSNENFFLKEKGKAGVSYHNGKRPKSRGVAMNPVDHPLGGGEGKSSGGRQSCSPWGWLTKGPKTATKKKKRLLQQLKNKVNKFFD